jgi:phosphoribosylaminoimidazole-succinocarboxamide synthase
MVCGIQLPDRLRRADKLPEPIYTPATKAEEGHDMNISFNQSANIVGHDVAEQLRTLTLSIYQSAADIALERGLILADTKFEFGRRPDGTMILIDEVLTPDSSRYWLASQYSPGHEPVNFDKQYVRDWLASQDWNKTPPAPALPAEVIAGTRDRYREALRLLTGTDLPEHV